MSASLASEYTLAACSAYREAAKTPLLTSARIESVAEGLVSVSTKWSQSNLATNQKVKFTKSLVVRDSLLDMALIHSSSPVAVPNSTSNIITNCVLSSLFRRLAMKCRSSEEIFRPLSEATR